MKISIERLFPLGLATMAIGCLCENALTSGIGFGVVMTVLMVKLEDDGPDDFGA